MKTSDIIIKEREISELVAVGAVTDKFKKAAQGAGGAVKALAKGQSAVAGAKSGVAKGKASATVKKLGDQTFDRWNQKIQANQDLNTDTELIKFMAQFRKQTPPEEWPGPQKGTAKNVGKTRAYITDLVGRELASGEFGQREPAAADPNKIANTQKAGTPPAPPKDVPGVLQPDQQGTKEVETKDPKEIPVGTQFTIGQAGGGTATYKWEGQQWTKLGASGKFQGGQIKNDLAFKLYTAAVDQGTALAPISAKPVAAVAAPGEAPAPGEEPAKPGEAPAPVDANKDGKDDATGEPMSQLNKQAGGEPGADADKVGPGGDPAVPEPGNLAGIQPWKAEINKANLPALKALTKALGIK